MYADRTTNLDALLGTDRDCANGKKRLDDALADARRAQLQVRFLTEMMPALRTAARAYLAFVLAGVRAHQVRAELLAAGHTCPAPATLTVNPTGLAEMVTALIESDLIDPNDSLLAEVPATTLIE